ncbi:MAG: hypothetical protein WKF30_13105 [Pyrinomonadaceae bacterium]
MIARLKPSIALTKAQSQINAHNAAVAESYPQAKMIAEAGFRSVVVPLRADHVASIRPTLLLLQAGVLLLLLIGGVNLVNLLLIAPAARGTGYPAGPRREPTAGGESSDNGNRFTRFGRRIIRAGWGGGRNPTFGSTRRGSTAAWRRGRVR